jgi:hypothetical protein
MTLSLTRWRSTVDSHAHICASFHSCLACGASSTRLALTPHMPSLRFLLVAPAFLCVLAACTFKPGNSDNPASAQSGTGENAGAGGVAQHNVAGAKNGSHAGAAGRTGVTHDPKSSGGSAGALASDSAGAGSTTDPSPEGDAGQPPPPCDLQGNCSTKCEDSAATCGVVSGNECEFQGFVGATAQVSCGKPSVVGTACCGACDCVPVEVYFDGTQCWQGTPQCKGRDPSQPPFMQPHPTTTPNPSFTPPSTVFGSFYPGNGGEGGNEAAGGSTGTSTAGTSSGGAPNSAAGDVGTAP